MEENATQINGGMTINVKVSVRNVMFYVLNTDIHSCKNGKHLASIMDDSAIICDEVIESYNEDAEAKSLDETKAIPNDCNEKKATCKTQKFLQFTCIFIDYYSIIDSC